LEDEIAQVKGKLRLKEQEFEGTVPQLQAEIEEALTQNNLYQTLRNQAET
jgi:hypothetical protein